MRNGYRDAQTSVRSVRKAAAASSPAHCHCYRARVLMVYTCASPIDRWREMERRCNRAVTDRRSWGFVQSVFEVFFFRFRSSRARPARVGVHRR